MPERQLGGLRSFWLTITSSSDHLFPCRNSFSAIKYLICRCDCIERNSTGSACQVDLGSCSATAPVCVLHAEFSQQIPRPSLCTRGLVTRGQFSVFWRPTHR